MISNKCQPFRGLVRHLYKAPSCLIGDINEDSDMYDDLI